MPTTVKLEQLIIRQVYLIICDYTIKPSFNNTNNIRLSCLTYSFEFIHFGYQTTSIIINNSNMFSVATGLVICTVNFADESPSARLNSLKKEKFDKIPERLDCCHGPEQIPERLDWCQGPKQG